MIENAIRTIRTLLPPPNTIVTQAEINSAVDIALGIPQYSSLDRNILIKQIQTLYSISVDDYRIIESKERRRPWLSEQKSGIQWRFWSRYKDYLTIDKNFAPDVLNKLDRLTDGILDGLFDPRINAIIDKRGLVVGQVQSGKTSNYTGLICKAADAGYKLIIVLAGIHNNLRSQTQFRLDEGFLGFDTQHQRAFNQNNLWIGVGRLEQGIVAHSLTSSLDKGDFTAGAANALGLNFNTNEPILAVVKKNAGVLNRLLQWLLAQTVETSDGRRVIRNKSLLLIDDEADNASINTNPEDDQSTRINGLIRHILRLFDRSGYVGYTATPFANIFIPISEDDLFPRDFIINLPAPSNYIGPEKVFGFEIIEEDELSDTVLPIVRRVDDHEELIPDRLKHKDNFYEFGHDPMGKSNISLPIDIPDSLKLAIKCFIITCAIRRLRGQTSSHNSMLIHVSRLIIWQQHIKGLVDATFDYYRIGIEMNIPSIIEEFRIAFEVDTTYYKSYQTTSHQILNSKMADIDANIAVHTWPDVMQHLNDAASRIIVREIHGGSKDALNYYDHPSGLSVIAIGGDKLSRGLTLEGLSVSYYLRTSKMYDTLMQMGRWFGYRPGYVDLCRLYVSRELNEWFCHITHASQQLRDEFDYMSDVAGSTPDQYALKVRTHPGVLQISASNKIRRAVEVRISWSGRLVESYELSKEPKIIQRNFEATKLLTFNLGASYELVNNSYLWRNVNVSVIKDFLRGFETYDNLKSAAPSNLLRFIEFNERSGNFNNWAVAFVSKLRTTKRIIIGDLNIGLILRREDEGKSAPDLYFIKKSHIISPGDEFIDLNEKEISAALERTRISWKASGKTENPIHPNGEIVRNTIRKPDRPLLLIYLLDAEGAQLPSEIPIVGYALSFPANDHDDSVGFAVNEMLLSQFYDQEDSETNIQEDDD